MSELTSPPTADTARSESQRLDELRKQLVEDAFPLVERLRAVPDQARPLVERVDPLVTRARSMFDVFLPFVDEMRPLMDDLGPVVHDLRLLLGELLSRGIAAARRLDATPLRSLAGLAGGVARPIAALRSTLRVATPKVSVPRVPRVAPHIGVPSFLGRLRPGRWVLRTVAVGIIAFAAINPLIRDTILEELSATRSFLETLALPAIEIPHIEIPAIELPTIELPTLELPKVDIPNIQLPTFGSTATAAPATLAPAQFDVPPLTAYGAAFESQAAYPTAAPNGNVEWVVALRNTGTAGWHRGVAGAQASIALTDGTEVAVQSTAYVAPGQVGWFIVRFRAPASPGTQSVALIPRIDGRGRLPDLGLYTLVTVR